MNSQVQTHLFTIIFVLFFASTLSPVSLILHIATIFNMYHSSTIKSSSSLPCTYMAKSGIFLKKFVNSKTAATKSINTVTPVVESISTVPAAKHIPITIPATLIEAQKEVALPFLTQEPHKTKKKNLFYISQSKGKSSPVSPNFHQHVTNKYYDLVFGSFHQETCQQNIH